MGDYLKLDNNILYYADIARYFNKELRIASYVQDVEYKFSDVSSDPYLYEKAKMSLRMPYIRFCKTKWIAEVIHKDLSIEVSQISPSVDPDISYPDPDSEKLFDISCMYRPSTPQRGGDLLVEVLHSLVIANNTLKICVLGVKIFLRF